MDQAGSHPRIGYILAAILVKKQDFKGAAECWRAYLKSNSITDRDQVTKMLADIEKQARASN